MKRVLLAGIILTLLLAFCGFSIHRIVSLEGEIGQRLREIEQAALSGDGAATFRLTRSFCQDWEGWEAQLASLVQHHALERIDESVARLLPLLAAGEEGGFLSELAVIRALSAHIRESELPYPKNLI